MSEAPHPPAPHLIVLRGNSASGKTTLARELQLALGRGTANIGQDHFRRVVLREHDVPHGANITLIEQTARQCLGLGWHTIVEGILFEPHYGEMLRRLAHDHRGPVHAYWLDLPLAETLERHRGRPLAAEVSCRKLREWFHPPDLLGLPGERVLDARPPVAQLVATITADVGPVVPRPDPEGARFL